MSTSLGVRQRLRFDLFEQTCETIFRRPVSSFDIVALQLWYSFPRICLDFAKLEA